MRDIGAVGKDSKNTTQGFMFRGIDAVMNAINPALIKNKVFVVPTILNQEREERQNSKGTTLIYSICTVKYTFFAEDGTSVDAIVIGEGMDTGDKATNKAMSIAFKYACFQVFCIPTEEMKDPDEECHEVKPKMKPLPQINDKATLKEPKKVEKAIKELDKKFEEQKKPEEVGYPPMEELLKFGYERYPRGSKPLANLLSYWGIEKLEDASQAQLMVIWSKNHGA